MTSEHKPLVQDSGQSRRAAPDHKSTASIASSLGELFQLYRGKRDEECPVLFSWIEDLGRPKIVIAVDGKAPAGIKQDAERFLMMVAGAAGDFKAGIDAHGLFSITESPFRWTLGINRMSGALGRDLQVGRSPA